MRKRQKYLFCGLGSIGQRHVRNLRSLVGTDAEVLAYRARGQNTVLNEDMTVLPDATLESTYNIRSFSRLEDALSEQPDAVFITNPNVFHIPIALEAARAGCHLFLEKPISHSLEDVDNLVGLVESRQLVAFVAYQFRFHPGLRLLKSMIDEGRLGQLAAAHIVNGEYLPGWHPYEDYRQTHAARRSLGGGCLRIQTHELDASLWLFGMPTHVFAVGGHLSRLEVDVEDSVSMLLRCEHAGRPVPIHIHLDYLQRPAQRTIEVVGDTGKARYDYYANRVEVFDTATGAVRHHEFAGFSRNQMFLDEMSHFLACVRGEAKPLIDLREGALSLKMSLAAERSLKTAKAVEMADV